MANEREVRHDTPGETTVDATIQPSLKTTAIHDQAMAAADRILRPKDELVYLGLNEGAPAEAARLNKLTKGAIVSVTDSEKDDQLTVGKQTFDLANEQEARRYLTAIGVPEDKHAALVTLMQDVLPDSRDEIGQMIRLFWEAEHGERTLDRLVMSGHSSGSSIWGDQNGIFLFTYIGELAKVFPRAGGQIRHIMLSACNTGGEFSLRAWNEMFPSLESIWAYIERSPGAASGAMGHQEVWNRATQNQEVADMAAARKKVARQRDGDNVVTWTKTEGYQGGKTLEIQQAIASVQALEYDFNRFYYGDAELHDPHSGPLRDYYQAVIQLFNHSDLPADQRAHWDARKQTTLLLLFFKNVRVKFADRLKPQLDAGYQAAGIPQPNWKAIDRGRAWDAASTLSARCTLIGASAADEACHLVKAGLAELSGDVLAENYT